MPASPRSTRTRRWLGRWVLIVTAGEAIGFAVPAVVGAMAVGSGWFIPLLLMAAAVEGALLGGSQALVLRRSVKALNQTAWMWLTVAAAVVAYGDGLVPSTFAGVWTRWHWPAQGLLFAFLAVILLGSIGTAQWWELRRHLRSSAWWIAGNAVAWLLGLGVFFAFAPPLWHEGQHVGVAVLIGLMAGVLMAATMAVVTGWTLLVILRRQ